MRSDDRAIDNEVFHVRVIDDPDIIGALPDPSITPTYKPLVDAVPLAILGRQESPRGSGPSDPKDNLDKPLALSFAAYVQVWLAAKELENLGPLFWR